jgi:hypothetical protein
VKLSAQQTANKRRLLVDPEHPDAVEAARIGNQHPPPLVQHGSVRAVPRHPERLRDPSDREVLADDRDERPPQSTPGDLRPRLRRRRRVLSPHMATVVAAPAAQRHLERGGPPPERLMRQPAHHAVAHGAFGAAAPAPTIRLDDPAGQRRPVGFDTLADHLKSEPVEAAERSQIRGIEDSVAHGRGLSSGLCENSHHGRPRPPHHVITAPRIRAHYTLVREEPDVPAKRGGSRGCRLVTSRRHET